MGALHNLEANGKRKTCPAKHLRSRMEDDDKRIEEVRCNVIDQKIFYIKIEHGFL